MRTVLIVGAGGSRAQAASYRPVRTLGHPPLDGDFFEKSAQLAKEHVDVERHLTTLRQLLALSRGPYDPWNRPSVTMEQFFADVYYGVAAVPTARAAAAAAAPAIEVFIETVRLYSQVLAETTNWVSALPRPGDASSSSSATSLRTHRR